jgi:halimadienyl-diphosphate synthase
MLEKQSSRWTFDTWQFHTRQLLNEMGTGLITPSAYDTAWVARLIEQDQDLAEAALEWLCTNQLADGSWGTKKPVCYHDRVICTLSALIALAHYPGDNRYRNLITKGKGFMDGLARDGTRRLMANPAGATVGFEMLAPALLAEANQLGILENQGDNILRRLESLRHQKLAKLSGKNIDRTITAAFSVEMVGENLSRIDIDNLPETNGSIAYSPSATTFYLLKIKPGEQTALAYLSKAARNGAFPYVSPTDVFECAWSLWNLAMTDWGKSLKDSCTKHLEILERAWKPGIGVAAATGLSLIDGDDTAMTFEAVRRWGHSLDTKALLSFEAAEHFLCFKLEADPSISTNIHLLGALRGAGYDHLHPSVQKILGYLSTNRMASGMWVDKWHLSPYYPTAHAIIACTGYEEELIKSAVQGIIASQNQDGSWGRPQPTAEETAYAIQALCTWKRHGNSVDNQVLRIGAEWLTQHFQPPYPPLWVGKCLYCPERVVQATILSALGMVFQEIKGDL